MLVRRQGHSKIRVGWGHHERRYAAVKTASEGLGIQSVAKDLGMSCGLNRNLDASATTCLVSRRGLGKAKHVDMQNLWIQEASKSGRFCTRKVGTNVNPADLMTKPLAKLKIEQLMGIMGYEFMGDDVDSKKGRSTGTRRLNCLMRVRHVPNGTVDWWHIDGHCARLCEFLTPFRAHCGAQFCVRAFSDSRSNCVTTLIGSRANSCQSFIRQFL